ncbi:uncharacterized protein PV07_01766 [Cladophialophora immunda]|uniref:Uncharacterized protein n=1 Tax=Cladophialophora immunda TaxID=569365 RepID=A0A0D2CVB1_9EURO|nr:uncharacterized protein PV07_01766 [Cladophialophora immunda]KIW35038.1 hypothetical protein PV07_01766 [Cladophialophora immunda]
MDPSGRGSNRGAPRRGGSGRGVPRGVARGRGGASRGARSQSGPSRGTTASGLSSGGPSQAGTTQSAATQPATSQGGPNLGNPSNIILPVNRRLGYQENPPDPPPPRDDGEREARITALRHQLAYPHALPGARLRWYLQRNNWDVNRAAAEFWQYVDNPSAINLPDNVVPPIIRRGTTVERERLQQVHDMQTALRKEFPERSTGNVEMMLLHHACNFITDAVDEELAKRNGDYDDFELEAARLSQPADSQLVLDQRLAEFLHMSATNSVYSAQKLLEQHDWNLASATEAWMAAGGLHVIFPPQESEDQEEHNGLRGINVNRPPQVRNGQFQFFDDDLDKFDQWVTEKSKKAGKGRAGSDPESSDAETDISGGHADELQQVLASFPSSMRKRRRIIADESRSAPQNEPQTGAEDSRQGRGVGARQARTRSSGRVANVDPNKGESDEANKMDVDIKVKIPGRDYIRSGRGATGIPRGAPINPDRSPAVVHCPDPTKFYIEYIKNGKYHIEWFQGRFGTGKKNNAPFRWNELPDNTVKEVEFDCHNKEHITKLNRWRNDRFVQITGVGKKEPNGGPFNKYEEQWLVEQEAMRIEEKFCDRAGQLHGHPGRTDPLQYIQTQERFENLANFPIPLPLAEQRDLANRFNQVFAGQRFYDKEMYKPASGGVGSFVIQRRRIDMGRVGDVPRPARTMTELRQHRCRIAALSKHFMLKHDKSKWKDVQDESELVSDVDSDFEQESGRGATAAPAAANVSSAPQVQSQPGNQAQAGTGAAQNANAAGGQTTSSAAPGANTAAQDDNDVEMGGNDDDEAEDSDLYG